MGTIPIGCHITHAAHKINIPSSLIGTINVVPSLVMSDTHTCMSTHPPIHMGIHISTHASIHALNYPRQMFDHCEASLTEQDMSDWLRT